MTKFRFLLLALIVIQSYSFDTQGQYYVLQLEWPGTVCDFYDCQNQFLGDYDGYSWTIHGLWPSSFYNNKCNELSFCTKQQFYPSSLGKQTYQGLDQSWIGLYNPSQAFRSHEWTKHGSCWDENDDLVAQVRGMTTEQEYFETALQLWNNYDLYSILKKAGITPNDTKMYYTDDIMNAISAKLNKKQVQLLCTKDKNRNLFLESVSFCFDEKYQPIECPCSIYGGIPCGSGRNEKVYYTPFQK